MKLTLKEAILFALLGDVMFASKILMEPLPNMHLLGVFTVAFTVVFRQKALYPIGVYLLVSGLFYGFSPWWFPQLYVWVVLWGVVMLLPKNLRGWKTCFYIAACSAHGFLFGLLYAPAQALILGLDGKALLAWIVAGIPFDVIHGISNLLLGVLIPPLIVALRLAKKYT